MANPVAKSREALYADIDAIMTDGGGLTTAEQREIIKNIIASMANIDDDYIPGAYSTARPYSQYDIATISGRVIVALVDMTAGAFDASKWRDIDYEVDSDQVIDIDITGLNEIDLSTDSAARVIKLESSNGTETISNITGGINGYKYKFYCQDGLTVTFNHIAIGSLSGTEEISNLDGANVAIVGRVGDKGDWIEYKCVADGLDYVEEGRAKRQ